MPISKHIFDFYIRSSIHVALSAYCLIRITEKYLNIPNNENLNYFIFFGTISSYNYIKYRTFFTSKKLLESLTTIISLIIAIYFSFHLSLKTIIALIPFTILTFCYQTPLNFKNRLRNIPYAKIFIIAFVWTGATIIAPALDSETILTTNTVLGIIQRFIFVIILTLPFDIRDVKQDNVNLKTLPQTIGVKQTKKLGFILLIISMSIEFYISPNQETRNISILISTFLLILLQRATIHQTKYYSSFWVEAIPIFWFLILHFKNILY